MILKNILRNNLVLFYSAVSFFTLAFLLLIAEKIGINDTFHYILLVISINISNGYFTFGFSFDYHPLLHYKSIPLLRQFLLRNAVISIISTLLGFCILMSYLFIKEKEIHFIYYLGFINAIFNIPINIVLSAYAFSKINLFHTKFIIAAQAPKGYLIAFSQIITSAMFYYFFTDENFLFSLILLGLIYIIFFLNLNNISKFLKTLIRNEYHRN